MADCDMLLLWGQPCPWDSSTVVRTVCVESSSSSLIRSSACSFITLSSWQRERERERERERGGGVSEVLHLVCANRH